MPSNLYKMLMDNKLCALARLEIGIGQIVAEMAHWEDPERSVRFTFQTPTIRSIETVYSEEDFVEEPHQLLMPWDLIGFESDFISPNNWRFCLVTHVLEIVFESTWPEYSLD